MSNKLNVCIVFGGVSSEHDISLISVSGILQNIDTNKYNIFKVGITKQGEWLLFDGELDLIKQGEWYNDNSCRKCVISPDNKTHGLLIYQNDSITEQKIDVIFPVLHGKNGEDGTIQGLFDLSGIPYVGCGVLASSICMDKSIANQIMQYNGIDRCEWDYLQKADLKNFDTLEQKWATKLGYPIFVKPSKAGSSIGISKAKNKQELKTSIETAFNFDDIVVLERFVKGKEIECAVIGNTDVTSTLPGEIITTADFYDFDDKYVSGTSSVSIPAQLEQDVLENVSKIACKAYTALRCTGLARVDFFIEENTGKVLLNEINTLPGFTPISMYPKLMVQNGIGYTQLLDKLIDLAIEKNNGN